VTEVQHECEVVKTSGDGGGARWTEDVEGWFGWSRGIG
jgi:hypothetical protein